MRRRSRQDVAALERPQGDGHEQADQHDQAEAHRVEAVRERLPAEEPVEGRVRLEELGRGAQGARSNTKKVPTAAPALTAMVSPAVTVEGSLDAVVKARRPGALVPVRPAPGKGQTPPPASARSRSKLLTEPMMRP